MATQRRTGIDGNSGPGAAGRPEIPLADAGVIQLISVFRRRWPLFAWGLVICWLLAVAGAVLLPPTFQSSAKVLILRQDPTVAASGVNKLPEVEAPRVTAELLATHVELLRSRKIVFGALQFASLDQLPSILAQIDLDEGETATDYVVENLSVTRGGEGSSQDAHVLNVSFRHREALDAQRVVAAIVERYQAFLNEEFVDVNAEAARLISEARGQLAEELRKAEEEYIQFSAGAPLMWQGQQGSTNGHLIRYEQMQLELARLEVELGESQTRLDLVEQALREMEEAGASDLERLALIDAGNAERVSILAAVQQGETKTAEFQSMQAERTEVAQTQYQNLLELLAKEKTLLAEVGPAHAEVINTQNRLVVIREFLADRSAALIVDDEESPNARRLVDAYVALLRHDLKSVSQRRAVFQAAATEEEAAAKSVVQFALKDEELRSKVARNRQLHTAVVDRLREINLTKDYTGFIHQVIASPEPGDKVWPNLPLLLVLGTCLGLVLGCGAATAAELGDRSFHDVEEIEEALGLPVLAHLPPLTTTPRRGGAARQGSGSGVAPLLCVLDRPRSEEAEVFHGLRAATFFGNRGRDLRILAITSPGPQEGKSIVAANLAACLAQSGRRVLLIDCHLRRPHVDELLGVPNVVGLADVVAGRVELPDAVQAGPVSALSLLTSGLVPQIGGADHLLASREFRQFLEMVRDRYDHVLLDCPSILAQSDTCFAAAGADGVLLVLRASRNSRPRAQRAVEMLGDSGASLFGSVVNTWGLARGGRHYSRKYETALVVPGADDESEPDTAPLQRQSP